MSYTLAAGGKRPTTALLSFNPATSKIELVSENKLESNSSIVKASHKPSVVYSIKEDNTGDGSVFSVDLKNEKLEVSATRKASGGPAHVHYMKDGSGIVVTNYFGGSAIFIPVESDGSLSQTSESPRLVFPYIYEGKTAPHVRRQNGSHAHQCIEGKPGELFVPDLGSDRVWILNREGESGLVIKGYLQAPEGSGPRHAVISPDLKYLYLLTELGHTIYVYSIDDTTTPIHPIPGSAIDVIPPSAPSGLREVMNAAEITSNPSIPNVLYASNRYELHLKEKNNVSDAPQPPEGDAICVVLLSKDGVKAEKISWVRTGCDIIRALSISADGMFAAVAGQDGGGLEIYSISGARGDEWTLAARLSDIKGVAEVCWL